MRFSQALQTPILIEWGSLRIGIPKFTLADFAAWAEEEQSQREGRLTRGMEDDKRFHFLAFYNIMPLDAAELRRLVRTPAGILKVNGVCLSRARITGYRQTDGTYKTADEPLPDETRQQILSAPQRDQERLAVVLADVEDHQLAGNQKAEAPPAADDATLARERPDPLPSTATAASSG